ncbi:hypothetical protein U1Q18_020532 [Sarracenia purpurea var. burkii]
MDRDYFLNAGIPPPSLHFEPSPIPNWESLSSTPELNRSSEQSPQCFLNPSWDNSTDHFPNFESAMSSMVSSPATASNSAFSNDSFAIRELIGKLGSICNSGEISPQSHHPFTAATAAAAYIGGGNKSTTTSCYSTPLHSLPKIQFPIMNHFAKEKLHNLGNFMPTNPNLPAVSADPGFAERAAKFSCFGSRSFNGRINQLGSNNLELRYRATPLMGTLKFPRVSSSPSLEAAGSPTSAQELKNFSQNQKGLSCPNSLDTKFGKIFGSPSLDRTEFASSNDGSSVSEQFPEWETGLKTPSDLNSRKRKAVSVGKSKEIVSSSKVMEAEDDPNVKRTKSNEGSGSENSSIKTEEETKGSGNSRTGDEGQKQAKANPNPPPPEKDYIHVRARRGQATDSHSLAERVRREKISERMKLLQDLVPGCNKVTGKALMLDEIINYVQSLQRQVEEFQPNDPLPHPLHPLHSSASAFFGQSVDQNIGLKLPLVDALGQDLPKFPTSCEDDLQTIVQMGFGQNPNRDTGFRSQSFPGSSQT